MTANVRIKCCRCRRDMTVDMLDRRWPEGPFHCAECSTVRVEGAPGVAGEDGAVEIEELGADGAVVSGSVKF